MKDKDIERLLDLISMEAETIVLTTPTGADGRAAEPRSLARRYDPRDLRGSGAVVTEGTEEALMVAVEEMRGMGGVVLVTGSFYTAAGVLDGLRGGKYG